MTSRMTFSPQPDTAPTPDQSTARPRPDATMAGFDAFYAENVERLTGVLGATLNNADLGAEAAAEAMVRACERWSTVHAHPNAMGWCYRVGFNWATSRWRKRRRETIADPATFHHVAGAQPADPHHELRDAVRHLPIEQRSVVLLKYWMGWTAPEIAEALNIAPGTVGSRLNRALAVLRSSASGARE